MKRSMTSPKHKYFPKSSLYFPTGSYSINEVANTAQPFNAPLIKNDLAIPLILSIFTKTLLK